MRYQTPLTILFFLLLTVEIIADSLGYYAIGWATKPLFMPVLLLLFWLNNEENTPAEKLFFSLALVFSLAGDVLLMLRDDSLFVFGLGAFLTAHLCFIASFYGRIKGRKISLAQWAYSLLPFAIFVSGFLSVLIPNLQATELTKPLVLPITVYSCIIGTMGFTALMRRGGVSNQGFGLVMAGALVFMLSDSFIALNRFITPLPQPTLLIMATYGIAQYLLTVGTLKK